MNQNFDQLKLSAELLQAIKNSGYAQMTPIQAASIPLLLEGKDIVGRSQTGSGKTAAFALPILQRLKPESRTPQALILAPTRELTEQIVQEIRKLAKGLRHVQVMALIGGQSASQQIKALEAGAQIIVGTPGRTLEFINNGAFDTHQLKTLVLDEADRMLDEGFTEEVTQIIERLPLSRQTVFFSATYPESIEQLSNAYQKDPQTVSVASEKADAPKIEQFVYVAEKSEKIEMLLRILQYHPARSVLIFCRTKAAVAEIKELLNQSQVATRALHGDLEQADRNKVMALFRSGSLRVLVATDVAARGIDIDNLELVINFDLPSSADIYLHRIGRTGRAGKSGVAVSIADAYEAPKVEEIEAIIGKKFIRNILGAGTQPVIPKTLQQAEMKMIHLSGGRKDKIRAGDIVGALTAAPDGLNGADIGKIDLQENFSYIAVPFALADKALAKLTSGKIKGRKYKASYVK